MQEITVYDIDDNIVVNLVQWDSNVQLRIKEDGIDRAYNVHFFNCLSLEAAVVKSTYADGVLSTVVPNDLLTETHPITGYIYVEKDSEHKSVYCFRIILRKRPKPANFIYTDQKEYITFDKILGEVKDYASKAKASEEAAKESETNAKESEENAGSSAFAAKDSEDKAKASESAAKESETAAKESETNANDSAIAAKDSETNAKASEVAAKGSEDKAKASESAAAKSEQVASEMADEASTSANTAQTKATEASGSATAAKASEVAAKESEDNAAQSEQTAIEKANEASASADTSTTKAGEASNSATLAESWAVGGTGTRQNEDKDNSKYYSEQAKNNSDMAKEYLTKVEQAGDEAVDKIQNALDISKPDFLVDLSTGHLMYSGGRFTFAVNDNGHLEWGMAL